MRKRTIRLVACFIAIVVALSGGVLLFVVLPRIAIAVHEQIQDKGPWDLEFPAVARVRLLGAPRRIDEKRVDHAIGRWTDGSRAILSFGETGLEAKDADLVSFDQLELGLRCHGVLDHEGGDPGLIVFYGPGFHTPNMLAAFGPSQEQLWRFLLADAETFDTAAPLYDEDGLYGVALGTGGDTGIVAVDLRGEQLWDIPKQYVLHTLSTHPSLPGKVLVLGGDWSVFDHDRNGVERMAGGRRASFGGSMYTHDGVVFSEPDGGVGVIVVGVSFRDVPHVARCDERGGEVWRADLSEQAEGVVLLGTRAGKFVFAAALEDKAIVVFDEDGTLLDQTSVPGDPGRSGYHVSAFDGGEVGPGRRAITIDTNLGDYLYEVDLGE